MLAEPVDDVLLARLRGDLERDQLAAFERGLHQRLAGRVELEVDIPLGRPGGEEVELAVPAGLGGQQHFLDAGHAGAAPVEVRQPVVAGAEEGGEAGLRGRGVGHLVDRAFLGFFRRGEGGHVGDVGHPGVVQLAEAGAVFGDAVPGVAAELEGGRVGHTDQAVGPVGIHLDRLPLVVFAPPRLRGLEREDAAAAGDRQRRDGLADAFQPGAQGGGQLVELEQRFGDPGEGGDRVDRVGGVADELEAVGGMHHELAVLAQFPAFALLELGAVEAVVEQHGADDPVEVGAEVGAEDVVGLEVHPRVLRAHREVVGQVLGAAESVGTRGDRAEAPDVERLGVGDAFGPEVLGALGGDFGALAVEAGGGREQVGVAVGKGRPAEPALVLRHEVAAHPAAEVGGDRLALEGRELVVVVALDAAVVVADEDAAVEKQRELAIAVGGLHVAEQLIVPADEVAGIFGVPIVDGRLSIDVNVGARPKLLPALQLVLFRGGALVRGEHGLGLGRPCRRIGIDGGGEAHGDDMVCAGRGAAGPGFAIPELPAHFGFGRLGGHAAVDGDGGAGNAAGRDIGHEVERAAAALGEAVEIDGVVRIAVEGEETAGRRLDPIAVIGRLGAHHVIADALLGLLAPGAVGDFERFRRRALRFEDQGLAGEPEGGPEAALGDGDRAGGGI